MENIIWQIKKKWNSNSKITDMYDVGEHIQGMPRVSSHLNFMLAAVLVFASLTAISPTRAKADDLSPLTQLDLPLEWSQFVLLNNKLLFSAATNAQGRELWTTDGSAGGTNLLSDITPGAIGANPISFMPLGDRVVLFSAEGELWRTDGGFGGTRRVARVNSREPLATATEILGAVGFGSGTSTALLAMDDGFRGSELWRTDGTQAGTQLVKDINPGDAPSLPQGFASLGTTAFFSAEADGVGRELWRTDGTEAGTFMVKDVNPGPEAGVDLESNFVTVGGLVYFGGISSNGTQLWVTDGTQGGTHSLQTSQPSDLSHSPREFVALGDRLYFAVGDLLYSTDGTQLGTVPVFSFNTRLISQIIVSNSKLFLNAGGALVVSDGTSLGTQILRDNEGANIHVVGALSAIRGGVTYAGFSIGSGVELWRSDGTTSGTLQLTDVNVGEGDGLKVISKSTSGDFARYSTPQQLGDNLIFIANNGMNGPQLWKFGPAPSCVSDSDGDGLSDCLDVCPMDAALQVSSECGCSIQPTDFNVNGIVDCHDAALSSPPRKKLKVSQLKSTVVVKLPYYPSVTYELNLILAGRKKVNISKLSTAQTVKFVRMKKGRWSIIYRIIPTTSLSTEWSKPLKFTVK